MSDQLKPDLLARLLEYRSDGKKDYSFWNDDTQYMMSDFIKSLVSNNTQGNIRWMPIKTRRRLVADALYFMCKGRRKNFIGWSYKNFSDGGLVRDVKVEVNEIIRCAHADNWQELNTFILKLHKDGHLPEPESTPAPEPTDQFIQVDVPKGYTVKLIKNEDK